ncbi:MAG: hypothetical protein JXB35_17295, partial [Anaerolineae bacterium]|nr:hypothetical protein [Anaerolineae bacterium]
AITRMRQSRLPPMGGATIPVREWRPVAGRWSAAPPYISARVWRIFSAYHSLLDSFLIFGYTIDSLLSQQTK